MGDEKMVSAEEARGLLEPGDVYDEVVAIAMLEPLARTVIALHARAEQAERERDEAREQIAAVQALSNHPKSTPAETVHDLLCESERLYDMSVSERDEARAERDRLARILAVERGDESQAPEGWRRMDHVSGWRRRDHHGRDWDVRYARLGSGWHTTCVYLDGIQVGGEHSTALEAMEAADAAREVTRG